VFKQKADHVRKSREKNEREKEIFRAVIKGTKNHLDHKKVRDPLAVERRAKRGLRKEMREINRNRMIGSSRCKRKMKKGRVKKNAR